MAKYDRRQFVGCILGGAAGDALGYPVEFMGESQIVSKYGSSGIASLKQVVTGPYSKGADGLAPFSDDTQMTLFTAAGLLASAARGVEGGEDEVLEKLVSGVWDAYGQWLTTQYHHGRSQVRDPLWITKISDLNVARAPGTTCTSSIERGVPGSFDVSLNSSKGCGGVMRVAPVPLFCAIWWKGERDVAEAASYLSARVAALTHSHPLGWLPAALMSRIISHLLDAGIPGPTCDRYAELRDIVLRSTDEMVEDFRSYREARSLASDVKRAVGLADAGRRDGMTHEQERAAIHRLGEGWVGDEALTIALFASLLHVEDFGEALRCAVNHRGDSDSCGAVAGNILGAYLGIEAVKASMDLANLEQKGLLVEMAWELFEAGDPSAKTQDSTPWGERYR